MKNENLENIMTDSSTNRTIDNAISLVDKSTKENDAWRNKELGLNLVLLGLAEVNALRVSQLSGVVYNLEQKVFDPDVIEELDPRKVVELYKMGVEALNDSAKYIKSTLSSVNWENLELQLLSIAEGEEGSEDSESKDISKVASDLLRQLSSMPSTS